MRRLCIPARGVRRGRGWRRRSRSCLDRKTDRLSEEVDYKIGSLVKNEGEKKLNMGEVLEGKLGGRYFGAEVCQSMHQASDGRSEGGILRLHDEMRFDWSRANENERKRNRRGEEKT